MVKQGTASEFMDAFRPVENASMPPGIDKGPPGPQEVQKSEPKRKYSDPKEKAEAVKKQKREYEQRKGKSNKVVA
jgi:hypothetical protein